MTEVGAGAAKGAGSARRKLYRDPREGVLAGVCAGAAEYLDIDRTVMRVLAVLAAVFTLVVPTLVVYVALWFMVPVRPGAEAAARGAAPQQR